MVFFDFYLTFGVMHVVINLGKLLLKLMVRVPFLKLIFSPVRAQLHDILSILTALLLSNPCCFVLEVEHAVFEGCRGMNHVSQVNLGEGLHETLEVLPARAVMGLQMLESFVD